MTANLDSRTVESDTAGELYISATPSGKGSLEAQAEEVFRDIAGLLRTKGARIIQERVFSTAQVAETLGGARQRGLGDLDDGVAPSFLAGLEGAIGSFAGVQVHAVTGDLRSEVIVADETAIGRFIEMAGHKLITMSGISAPDIEQATEQALVCLGRAESVLERYGTDFLSVARTWMWLGGILSWYDDFNRVRNRFFGERALIGEGSRQSMPASTGIGVGPAGAGQFAIDLIAILEPSGSTEYLQAVGRQQCALNYGSAFSRAAKAATPGGETIFVSGTAAIDASGASTNIGDAPGQIDATIENVRAVLRDTACGDEDVVEAIVYCKTPEVEKVFESFRDRLPWPFVTVICDICRPELLFEIEATAMRAKAEAKK
ncbi:MAG: hypothetical protein JSU94_07255 [Phycisphaerales bacterium]|nr:MAG: hypothetical protein JSU94_07255 [Phycisphaerales bacterium]